MRSAQAAADTGREARSGRCPRAEDLPDAGGSPLGSGTDPELVKRTQKYRLKKTDLSAKSFGLNVAVVKYERKGRIYYKVQANHPSKLHSETLAVKAIQKSDPTWKHTQILEVFTERHPCANCGPDLKAVRSAIKQARSARGQPITDFRVYYSCENGAGAAAPPTA